MRPPTGMAARLIDNPLPSLCAQAEPTRCQKAASPLPRTAYAMNAGVLWEVDVAEVMMMSFRLEPDPSGHAPNKSDDPAAPHRRGTVHTGDATYRGEWSGQTVATRWKSDRSSAGNRNGSPAPRKASNHHQAILTTRQSAYLLKLNAVSQELKSDLNHLRNEDPA